MTIATISSKQLVGRNVELQCLIEARKDSAKAHGCIVLLGGEAGIGKTRLLGEFLASIGGKLPPYVATAECLQDAPRPFGPFRTILAKLVEHAPSTLNTLASDLSAAVAARSLAALIPDTLKASGYQDLLSSRIDKAELFAGVPYYVKSLAAKRAVVLAIEDLHWADLASMELLVHLAGRVASSRLIIVGTYRSDEIASTHQLFDLFGRLERERNVRAISLGPLGERDVRTLIRNALGNKYTLGADKIREVVSRSEGNPFFTEEMLKNTLEQQAQARPMPLPTSVRALTLGRLRALDRFDRNLIEHAAVFGQTFDADTLAVIIDCEHKDVLSALRGLREKNLVVEEPEQHGRFRFRHVLTRQSIYDDLLTVTTRELHAHIVRSLEKLQVGEAHIDDLAYHAWKARLRDATLMYGERAGDAALALRAAAQAAPYYERALECTDDDDVRIRLLGKAGEAYVQQSDFDQATASCMAQHELLLRHNDYNAAVFALTRAAGEFANGGKVQKALNLVKEFSDRFDARLDDAAADHLNASVARMATVCDDYDLARDALARVRRPESLAAFTHQVYWLAQLFCSEHFVDAALWKRAAAALRARNAETYPLMRSQMLHSIGSTAVVFAEHDEALRALDEAIAIDRELGFERALAYANAVKASVLCVQGRLNESRACALEALAEQEMFVVRVQLALACSPAAIALGDDELVERWLEDDLLNRMQAAGQHGIASIMLGMQGVGLLRRGRLEEACGLLNASIEGVQHQFAAIHLWPFASRYVDDAGLARLRSLCAKHAQVSDYRVMQACAALLDAVAGQRAAGGGLAQGRDRPGLEGGVAQLAQVAADRYAGLGWPMHQALALEVGGRLDDAMALYRQCGAIAEIRRLETRPGAVSKRRPSKSPRDEKVQRSATTGLSARERQVALLVAKGLSNRLIADQLSVAEKTVEKYVTAIFAKLSFSTRAQLAAYIARAETGT